MFLAMLANDMMRRDSSLRSSMTGETCANDNESSSEENEEYSPIQ